VPSQMRDFLRGSRISDTHFPHARIRTPRYDAAACRRPRARFSPPPHGGCDVPPDDAGLLYTSPSDDIADSSFFFFGDGNGQA
jgi:hypothetical protein